MLDRLLSENADDIKESWIRKVQQTYPTDSLRFIQGNKNRFANPVGHALRDGLSGLYDFILGRDDLPGLIWESSDSGGGDEDVGPERADGSQKIGDIQEPGSPRNHDTASDSDAGPGSEGPALDSRLAFFIKIRAVQEFSPAEAVNFVLLLKSAVREALESHFNDPDLLVELLNFETKLDRIELQAFEAYVRNREKIFELRARHLKEGPFRPFKRRKAPREEDLNEGDRAEPRDG